MQSYLQYLFQSFILKSQSPQFTQLLSQLLTLNPVDLTKGTVYTNLIKQLNIKKSQFSTTPTTSQFYNILTLLLSKNILKYSSSNGQIQLCLQNLLIYQRLYKFIDFAQKYLHKQAYQFIRVYLLNSVQNGMGFPVLYDRRKLIKLFKKIKRGNQKKGNTKNKVIDQRDKKDSQIMLLSSDQYNYHKLIYEYKQTIQHNKNQQNHYKQHQKQHKQSKSKSKSKPKHSKQAQNEPKHQQQTQQQLFMLNIEQLTKLLKCSKILELVNSRYNNPNTKDSRDKSNMIKLSQLINSMNNDSNSIKQKKQVGSSLNNININFPSTLQQLKYQKFQQHIFQLFSAQCLLVFNLIKKNSFITQKQLSKLTLLDILQTRRSLNQLIQSGFVYFYYQNSRTIVYKICDQQILYEKYVDVIARGTMNMMIMIQRLGAERVVIVEAPRNSLEKQRIVLKADKIKDKIIQLEIEVQRLDDIMLIFGA